MIIDRDQNVARADMRDPTRCPAITRVDEHAAIVVVGQAEEAPLHRILQLRISDAEIDVAIVASVGHVFQEPIDDRRRDHVGDALRDIAAVALERHADDFAVLHHGAAAVAGIDLRADLNREVLIDCRVRVELEIDARHNAGRH